MAISIDQNHPMRAVVQARTVEELRDVMLRLDKMPHIDQGVVDAASQRLSALQKPESKK